MEVLAFDGGRVRFRAASDATAHAVLTEAVARGTVHRFGPVTRTLHEIFTEAMR